MLREIGAGAGALCETGALSDSRLGAAGAECEGALVDPLFDELECCGGGDDGLLDELDGGGDGLVVVVLFCAEAGIARALAKAMTTPPV